MYAEVVVNLPQVHTVFDYEIPANLLDSVLPGCLVLVPFGKQTLQGVIAAIRETSTFPTIKPILSLVDPQPVLTIAQMKLAAWISEETLTPLAQCLELMLPPGLSQHADTLYHRIENPSTHEESFSSLQQRILHLLDEMGPLRGRQLEHRFKHLNWKSSMQALLRKGTVGSQAVLTEPTIHRKLVPAARLLQENFTDLLLSKIPAVQQRRLAVLQFLASEKKTTAQSWICAQTGAKPEDLKALQKLDLIEIVDLESIRDPLSHLSAQSEEILTLTPEQEQILVALTTQLDSSGNPQTPALLHGITGSGKTEIYLRLTEHVLHQGRQVIILVPEISLTPQTIRRFLNRFGEKVGVIHSRLSPGERYDTWRRIRSGEIQVVIGPRSALFAPCSSPALIILDECHDESYYQREPSPAYDSTAAAVEYARLSQALVMLGSATPSILNLHRAQKEHWQLFNLTKRVSLDQSRPHSVEPVLPPVEIVDMRQELQAGNRSMLSRSLQTALQEVLENHQQAILFHNRRGSSTYVFCRQCGLVLKCPRCDMSLTLHIQSEAQQNQQLQCHTCSYTRQMPSKCPECGSPHIRHFGSGTQKVQELVQQHYPKARILRWDAETAKGKNTDELLMNRFSNHQADILIGTQMVAKGLDLPRVTLVGVILADVGLNFPDYRTGERSFQLLTQVAGRAGRSSLGGKVIFQTFFPQHYAIQTAARHDFQQFFELEMAYRRQHGYPPFNRLVRMEYKHRQADTARETAEKMRIQLDHWAAEEGFLETEIKGPTPCYFQRVNGYYRWQILLSGPNPVRLLRNKPLQDWKIEVDPPSIL